MATAVVEERELLKTISWFDGFVVALANPSFLITGLGLSAFSLGGWGAVILWTVSVILGALHNYIYSETATMFPKLSGGIAIYAHEAWKKYFSFVGPVAAFGYWIGWSVVLSATGVVVGFLVQYEWYPSSRRLHQLESQLADPGADHLLQLPDRPDGGDHPRDLGLQRVGDAPGGLGRLRHRGTADVAAGGDDVPAVHHRRLAQLQPAQQHPCHRQLTGSQQLHARDRVAVCDVLVELRHGVLRHLRSRVPRHGPGHAQGAARRGDLRRDHLRPAADGGDGDVRRPEHDGREPLHLHAPDAPHPDGRLPGRPGGVLAVCGHRAGDEHRDRRRLARPVRHLAGRHDDQMAGQAEPETRARQTP